VEKCGESGNVYENKGSYPFEAGIYVKTGMLMLFSRKSTRTSLRISRRSGLTVPWRIHREENSFFCSNYAGISMKTKDSCGKVGRKRECL
jgi:hypothetical protein